MPLSTKLYGMYEINKGRVKAMRHVITPSVGYSYRPDFGDTIFPHTMLEHAWGYYQDEPDDTTGTTVCKRMLTRCSIC